MGTVGTIVPKRQTNVTALIQDTSSGSRRRDPSSLRSSGQAVPCNRAKGPTPPLTPRATRSVVSFQRAALPPCHPEAEAAELCRTSPDQAKRLLNRLVSNGLLVRMGVHRRIFYEHPPAIAGAARKEMDAARKAPAKPTGPLSDPGVNNVQSPMNNVHKPPELSKKRRPRKSRLGLQMTDLARPESYTDGAATSRAAPVSCFMRSVNPASPA